MSLLLSVSSAAWLYLCTCPNTLCICKAAGGHPYWAARSQSLELAGDRLSGVEGWRRKPSAAHPAAPLHDRWPALLLALDHKPVVTGVVRAHYGSALPPVCLIQCGVSGRAFGLPVPARADIDDVSASKALVRRFRPVRVGLRHGCGSERPSCGSKSPGIRFKPLRIEHNGADRCSTSVVGDFVSPRVAHPDLGYGVCCPEHRINAPDLGCAAGDLPDHIHPGIWARSLSGMAHSRTGAGLQPHHGGQLPK